MTNLDANSAGLGVLGGLAILVGLALLAAAYLAPTIVAYLRHSKQRLPVLVLNLLLGSTLAGWVVAMVMAVGRTEGQDVSQVVIDQYSGAIPAAAQRGQVE